MSIPDSAVPGKPSWRSRGLAFLRRHPVLCLVALTPGIPEYLSGSSSAAGIVIDPFVFAIFLAINVAMYGPGVLLIREAMIRWRKGWASFAALAVAYAVMEEGIADATIFNPHSPAAGVLGSYGHYLGVNWVWTPGVIMVHLVFSLGLPIVLLNLALPETRGRRLLTDRQIPWVVGILAADTALLTTLAWSWTDWWDGPVLLAASLLAIAGAIALARRLPADLIRASSVRPTRSPRTFCLLGLALFPVTILLEGVLGYLQVPAALTVGAILAYFAVFAVAFVRWSGATGHERHLIAFAVGCIVPIMLVGIVNGWSIPVVLLLDAGAALFFRHLWRKYPTNPSAEPPRAAALAAGVVAP